MDDEIEINLLASYFGCYELKHEEKKETTIFAASGYRD